MYIYIYRLYYCIYIIIIIYICIFDPVWIFFWCLKYCFFDPSPVKKAEEIADEHCVYLLCYLSTTGSWKKLWFFCRQAALKRALQMPWKRELQKQGHKSYGVEDAYKKCWHGPGLLPDFDDFARRHRLMQDGNETYFNKTVCKCRTANDCT